MSWAIVAGLPVLHRASGAPGGGPAPAEGRRSITEFSDRVVAGGPNDFLEVHHLILRGSDEFIGGNLAQLARDRFEVGPRAGPGPQINAEQRDWFREHYPAHFGRMRGAAALLRADLADDAVNVAALSYAEVKAACTVTYYPPARVADGVGVMSRNFDFSTGTFDGRVSEPGESIACSRPFVIEVYPDAGYAALFMCAFDLLGGAIDGVNEKGLAVALLADGQRPPGESVRPSGGARPGLNEIQIVRYLLETCADTASAQAALRHARLYSTAIPCHYVIADAAGNAFVWENGRDMEGGHAIDANGDVLVSANFLRHLHPDLGALPAEPDPFGSFNRVRSVLGRVRSAGGPLTREQVRDASCLVAPVDPVLPPRSPGRTLWHAMYFPAERRLDIDFYLGEAEGAGRVRRSGYMSFTLRKGP